MKTRLKIQMFVFSILLCVLSALSAEAQWVKSTASLSPNGYLSYPHPSAAYCSSNGGGEIYKSIDSGKSWQLVHDFGPFTTTSNVLFLNADTGFVQQYNRMHKTFDGGQTWQLLPDLFSPAFSQSNILTLKNIEDILYISASRGDTSFVFQSSDYGASFNIIYQDIEPNAQPLYVSYYFSNSAYMVHPKNDSTLFITHNNFASIDTLPYQNASTSSEHIMSFVDSSRGFFYGRRGAFSNPTRLRSLSNNTIRMDLNNLDATGILPALDMELGLQKSNGRVYACSEYGKIFWSANYGQHWNEQLTPVSQSVRSIAFATPEIGIAIAADGALYTNNGGDGPNGILDHVLSNSFTLYPNPSSNIIYFTGKNLNKIESLVLLNSVGSKILTINAEDRKMDISKLTAGSYYILVNTQNGSFARPFTKK